MGDADWTIEANKIVFQDLFEHTKERIYLRIQHGQWKKLQEHLYFEPLEMEDFETKANCSHGKTPVQLMFEEYLQKCPRFTVAKLMSLMLEIEHDHVVEYIQCKLRDEIHEAAKRAKKRYHAHHPRSTAVSSPHSMQCHMSSPPQSLNSGSFTHINSEGVPSCIPPEVIYDRELYNPSIHHPDYQYASSEHSMCDDVIAAEEVVMTSENECSDIEMVPASNQRETSIKSVPIQREVRGTSKPVQSPTISSQIDGKSKSLGHQSNLHVPENLQTLNVHFHMGPNSNCNVNMDKNGKQEPEISSTGSPEAALDGRRTSPDERYRHNALVRGNLDSLRPVVEHESMQKSRSRSPRSGTISPSQEHKLLNNKKRLVFVTYAVDDSKHRKRIMQLCQCLGTNNCLVSPDIPESKIPKTSKSAWLTQRYKTADVFVVCISPAYTKIVNEVISGEEIHEKNTGLSTVEIYKHLMNMCQKTPTFARQIVPLIFDDFAKERVQLPEVFRQDQHNWSYKWPSQYKNLLWYITQIHSSKRP